MDILCLSDLHFEIYRHTADKFIRKLRTPADVLILAGDICGGWQAPTFLGMFCQKYKHVVYVHGNHEFYRMDRPSVLQFTEQAVRENPNLHWLDCTSVEIDGVKFHGTPLWFKEAPLAPKHHMADFTDIADFESWVYSENRRAVDFLTEAVQPGDVVVTHHLPCKASLHPRYASMAALDPYFLCDVEGLIRIAEPALWFHGHTHASFDYEIHKTRVVSNPRGYGRENMADFSTTKIVTIPSGSEKSTSTTAGNRENGT